MELNLQRQSITINERIYDGSVEQPIECDALLPDYCPDIVKVLKCTVCTNIGGTVVNGERLTIEGNAVAHIYYCSEQGNICHTEYKIPFARVIELRAAPSHPIVSVKPSVDYVNCRAVNQRRVDVRGAISLRVKVTDPREESVVCDGSGGGLQLRREMVQATDLVGRHEVTFPVAEDLDLPGGKLQVGNILRTSYCVDVQDYKIVSGKVVAKGELLLRICYQPLEDAQSLETAEFTLPLSQIVDSDGVDEDCICDVSMRVMYCDLQARQNGDGQYCILALDAKIRACVTAYRHKEVPVATDCYSTAYESSCKTRPANFVKLIETVRENISHKSSPELPEGVEKVLDAWCEIQSLAWKQEGSDILVTTGLMVRLFARMEDGEVQYFEQPDEVEYRLGTSSGGCHLQFEPEADITACSYSLTGGVIELRCEIRLCGCVFCEVRCATLGEIGVDENKPKSKTRNRLYIYYADAGESIWDIAKHYNTSAGAIWEENNATDDILPGKAMLLIPVL